MIKKQNAFIESFRHRRVEKEIAKTKTSTEQFTQSDHGSLTPGSLSPDCWTPGEWYFVPTPCDGQGGLYGVSTEDQSWLPVSQVGCIDNPNGWVGFTFVQTICTSAVNDLYWGGMMKMTTSLDSLPYPHCIYGEFTIVRKGTYGDSSGHPFMTIGYGPISGGLSSSAFLQIDWKRPDFVVDGYNVSGGGTRVALTITQGETYSYRIMRNGNSHGAKVWVKGTTEPSGFPSQGLAGASSGRTLHMSVQNILVPAGTPNVATDVRFTIPQLTSGAQNCPDPQGAPDHPVSMLDFENGYTMTIGTQVDQPGYGQIPNQFPGTGGWFREDEFDDTEVPVVLPSVKAHTAFGGFLQQSRDPNFGSFWDTANEYWYTGAAIRRLDYRPSAPEDLFFKFVWIELGQGADGGEWTVSNIDPWDIAPYRRVTFRAPGSSVEGRITLDNASFKVIPWQPLVEYSCLIRVTASIQEVYLWSSENSKPIEPTLSWSVATSKQGGIRFHMKPGFLAKSGSEPRSVIKLTSMRVNGVSVLDCDTIMSSTGSTWGKISGEILSGKESTDTSLAITTTAQRINDYTFYLPNDATQVLDVWFDGTHAEPGLHYNFVPPRTISTVKTLPVGVEVNVRYMSESGIV